MDVVTMLLMSLAAAAAAAGFLLFEWRILRSGALLLWSAGFSTIVVGCGLSPLRSASFLLGVWFANGLLVVAHLAFLYGTARFTGRRIGPLWWGLLLPWAGLLLLPPGLDPTPAFAMTNSALVAVAAVKAAHLLLARGGAPFSERTAASDGLGAVFLVHGAFYGLKALLVPLPGAFVSLVGFKGIMIQVSLFEGILVEMLLALLMAAAVRRRREEAMAALAERDPLTGAFNRRAFESRAAAALRETAARRQPGALLLLDVDRFKAINDGFGHAAGDRILVALTGVLDACLPRTAIPARLGGDEFVILAPGLDEAAVAELGAAIRARLARASGRDLPDGATISLGAALFDGGPAGLDALMALADTALYEAKAHGRDRLHARRLERTAERSPERSLPETAKTRMSPEGGCCA
ncbi:UNVERIFIED_CONTAM: GGDEF domain-containing protein [Methylobacteriaceae bacterium AG10]|nr:GGDEF domain-containing protein [Methylobacteriaceae bacterium AG10]